MSSFSISSTCGMGGSGDSNSASSSPAPRASALPESGMQVMVKSKDFQGLPIDCCVTLDKSLNFSEPRCFQISKLELIGILHSKHYLGVK